FGEPCINPKLALLGLDSETHRMPRPFEYENHVRLNLDHGHRLIRFQSQWSQTVLSPAFVEFKIENIAVQLSVSTVHLCFMKEINFVRIVLPTNLLLPAVGDGFGMLHHSGAPGLQVGSARDDLT